jgi:hypothetical protein
MRTTSSRLKAMTGYLTDIEGSAEFFDNFLSVSRILQRGKDGRLEFRNEQDRFVFGGDCFDRGTGDLAIARMLVDLKKRHPDRVYLVLGNRDINKMKLTAELHPTELSRKPEDVPRPYYIPSEARFFSFEDYVRRHKIPEKEHHSATHRLKWLLSHTMGCMPTFELRRKELALSRDDQSLDAISDEDVVQSFLDSLKPNGAVAEYLLHARPGAVVVDSRFGLGAFNTHWVGFAPDLHAIRVWPYNRDDDVKSLAHHTEEERIWVGDTPVPGNDIIRHEGASIEDWMRELIKFARAGVEEWLAQPTFDSADLPKPVAGGNTWGRRRGGSALLAYPHRSVMGSKTCIISTFVRNGSLQNVDLGTVACLNAGGISRVLVGHQPSGETPSFICQPGVQVVCADSSYSSLRATTYANGRGLAASEIVVDADEGTLTVNGRTASGDKFSFDVDHDDDVIGRKTADGWWTKAYRNEYSEVLMQRTTDAFYSVESEWVPIGIARARLQEGAVVGGCGGSINWGLRREDLRPPGSGSCGHGQLPPDPSRSIKTHVAAKKGT